MTGVSVIGVAGEGGLARADGTSSAVSCRSIMYSVVRYHSLPAYQYVPAYYYPVLSQCTPSRPNSPKGPKAGGGEGGGGPWAG